MAKSKTLKKIAFFSGGAVFLLVLIAAAIFIFLSLNPSFVKGRLEKALNEKTGLSISLKSLKYRAFPLHFRVDGVRLTYRDPLGYTELDIGSMEASGKLLPLLKGIRPALSTVTLSRVSIVFSMEPAEQPRAFPNLEEIWRSLAGVLSIADRYIILGRLDIVMPEERLSLDDLKCTIRRGGSEKWDIQIGSGRTILVHTPQALTFHTTLKITARLDESDSPELTGSLRLRGADWKWEVRSLEGTKKDFHFDLDYRFLNQDLLLRSWELNMPRLLRMAGEGKVSLSQNPAIAVTSKVRLFDLAELAAAAKGQLPLPAGLILSGGADASFRYLSQAGRSSLDAELKAGRLSFAYPYRGSLISGIASLNVRAENFPEKRALSGRLEASLNRTSLGSLSAGRMVLGSSFLLDEFKLKLPDFQISCSDAAWKGSSRPLRFDRIQLGSRVEADLKARSMNAKSISLNVSSLNEFRGTAHVFSKPAPGGDLDLESGEMKVAALLDMGMEWLPPDFKQWEPSGSLQLNIALQKKAVPKAPLNIKLKAGLSGLTFHSPGFDKAAEKLKVDAAWEGEMDLSGRRERVPFRLELSIPAGEMLWSSSFINWKDNPFDLSCTGEWNADSKVIIVSSFLTKFPPVGSFGGDMSLLLKKKPEARLALSTDNLDLPGLLEFYRQQKGLPENSLNIKGESALELDLIWSSAGTSAEGHVKFTNGEISSADGKVKGSGIEADIPFNLSFGKKPENRWFNRTGVVSIKNLDTPLGTFKPFLVEFLAAPNLFLFAPVNMEIFGGRVRLGGTVLTQPSFKGGFRGMSTARIEELDLSMIPSSNPDVRLDGKLNAEFSAVTISPDQITTRGVVSAGLYGGRMVMVNTAVFRPFNPSRTIRGDISITGLDLKRLTDSVPFGQITGLVNVDVQDFALSYGQPESFTMNIKSFKKEGIPRKFSLKAVDDLTVLSSGSKSQAPPAKLLTTFVNSFNYDRIGISCSLKNDVFILRGTIVDKGKEYLVRRSQFFGIDVVNAKPNNRISFKDMLGRLNKISQSQEKK